MKPQVQKEHYFRSYDSKARFCSYWTQIEYVLRLQQPPVLEIGVGNRTVSDYLHKYNVPTVTLDLDPALRPDVAASITHLPFQDQSFGTVMACEVMEHLPFDQFPVCLRELARVSRRFAIISLPHVGKAWLYQLHLPGLGIVRRLFELSWWRRPKTPLGVGEHFWELEVQGYPRTRIEGAISASGWKIMERQRLWEFPAHQFFVLEKRPA